jgi:hypothetical protein
VGRGVGKVLLGFVCLWVIGLSSGAMQASATVHDWGPVVESEALPLPAGSPVEGPHPFLTVLCKFADVAGEPETPAFFERLLGSQYSGLGDYWREVSYGKLSLDGSAVTGWLTLPARKAAYLNPDGKPDLDKLAQDCAGLGGIGNGPTRTPA